MWINSGVFSQNGGCGYVLKPSSQRRADFNPLAVSSYDPSLDVELEVRIVAVRSLPPYKNGKAYAATVGLKIGGCALDDAPEVRTPASSSKGLLLQTWDIPAYAFTLSSWQTAHLDFVILAGKKNTVVGQAVIPMACVRTGLRAVPVKSEYGHPIPLCSILVDVSVTTNNNSQWRPVCAPTPRARRVHCHRVGRQRSGLSLDEGVEMEPQAGSTRQPSNMEAKKEIRRREIEARLKTYVAERVGKRAFRQSGDGSTDGEAMFLFFKEECADGDLGEWEREMLFRLLVRCFCI